MVFYQISPGFQRCKITPENSQEISRKIKTEQIPNYIPVLLRCTVLCAYLKQPCTALIVANRTYVYVAIQQCCCETKLPLAADQGFLWIEQPH